MSRPLLGLGFTRSLSESFDLPLFFFPTEVDLGDIELIKIRRKNYNGKFIFNCLRKLLKSRGDFLENAINTVCCCGFCDNFSVAEDLLLKMTYFDR